MMKRVLLAVVVFISIAFAACRHETIRDRQVFFLDSDFRDYTIFQPGSYWIYSNGLSSDSISLLNTSFQQIVPDTADYSWQESESTFSSSLLNDSFSQHGYFQKGNNLFYILQRRKNTDSLIFFSLKPAGYVLALSADKTLKYREIKDTAINNQPFSGVRIFENLSTPSSPASVRELWYAKNVGLIRKQLNNGETWQLQRFQVNQ